MAQTKRKRKRKHRGTAAGTVERPARGSGRRAQPARRQVAKTAAERRHERLTKPPTWRGSLNRAALAALVFAVIAYVALGRPVADSAMLALVALLVYVPMSYYTDLLMHKRYVRRHGAGPHRR